MGTDDAKTDKASRLAHELLLCFGDQCTERQAARLVEEARQEQRDRPYDESYTEVVFEVDLRGKRINLSVLDAKGSGHGYRLHGPKFGAVYGEPVTARHVLDQRDADEIRSYLRYFDRIQDRAALNAIGDDEDGPV